MSKMFCHSLMTAGRVSLLCFNFKIPQSASIGLDSGSIHSHIITFLYSSLETRMILAVC